MVGAVLQLPARVVGSNAEHQEGRAAVLGAVLQVLLAATQLDVEWTTRQACWKVVECLVLAWRLEPTL